MTARRWTRALLAAAAVVLAGHQVVSDVSGQPAATAAPAAPEPVRPVDNDCSGGHVVLTFDDGPRQHTDELLDRLEALHLTAVMFWRGHNVDGRAELVQRALDGGHVLGNHTLSHPDLTTGELPGGGRITPWGPDQIREELQRTSDLLVANGAPAPEYYRPPYGSVDAEVDAVARELGLRLVMSYGRDDSDGIVDSHDTEGIAAEEIVANVVGHLRDGAIVTMHDSSGAAALDGIEALQGIADAMNEQRLCATTDIRPDATGRALSGE